MDRRSVSVGGSGGNQRPLRDRLLRARGILVGSGDRLVAVEVGSSTAVVFSTRDGRRLREFDVGEGGLGAVDWSPDGRLTGKLASSNCYGQAKLDLILAADARHSFARPITGYSDHVSDLPFLQWADDGVAVNPSRGLARIAAKAGIRIEDWEVENMGSETR